MNRATMSVGRAQLLLGRLIGLAAAITVFFAFFLTLGAGGSAVGYILEVLLLCMAPPAAMLGLLFAGQRRLASYISLLGTVSSTALCLLMIIPLAASGGLSIGWIVQGAMGLVFLYTAITLARVGVGVRVTDGEQRQARQLRAARRAGTLALGPTEERQELPSAPPW